MLARLFTMAFCLLFAFSTQAVDITLDADNGVEYNQKEQKLTAVGNAVATKGDLRIKADTLIGWYAPDNKSKISKIEALGNVQMSSPQAEAFGDSMVYDVQTDTLVLKGLPARIKTPDAEITALGNMTYFPSRHEAVALDGVVATDAKGNKVHADKMTAYFSKDEAGKMVLTKIDIEQNVKILSNDAEISALTGTYHALDGKITLIDDVVINQKGNILKGAKAETNLNTGISKMLSGGKKRVSGVFKEKKEPSK